MPHQVINGQVVDTDSILTKPEYDRLEREKQALEDTARAETARQIAEHQERQFRQRQREQADREKAEAEHEAALKQWQKEDERLWAEYDKEWNDPLLQKLYKAQDRVDAAKKALDEHKAVKPA
jgi:hypothetical protein